MVFLILTLVGSRLKGLSNTLLNVIGLTGVVVSYIFWWKYYFFILEASGAGPGAIKNYAYLAGGNFLDIAIAAAIAVLVVLNVRSAALSSFRVDVEKGSVYDKECDEHDFDLHRDGRRVDC